MSASKRIPKYRHQKSRNLAVVRIDGTDRYLGRYGSPESRHLYDKLIQEWLANGRTLEKSNRAVDPRDEMTIVEVIARYWDHCRAYYGPETDRRTTTYNLKPALRALRELYGQQLAKDFDTLKLTTVRKAFIVRGQARWTVNCNVDRIRKMFRWAASNKLIRSDVWHELTTLERLKKGRSEAPEGKKVYRSIRQR